MTLSRTRYILFVVAGVFIAVAGFFFMAERRAETSRRAQRESLHAEPAVVAILEKGNARCPKQTTSYIWACGVLLEMEGPDPTENCSTRAEPRFAGNLDDDPMGLQWGWYTSYAIPAFPLENYEVFIKGARTQMGPYYPVNSVPTDIPQEPSFPQYDRDTIFDAHEPEAWAKHDAMPVAFNLMNFYPKKHSETLPSKCQLSSVHPKLPISVHITLPCRHLQNWRDILSDANRRLTAGVLEIDQGAQCDKPPKAVRFSVNLFNDDKIRAMRDWLLASPPHGP